VMKRGLVAVTARALIGWRGETPRRWGERIHGINTRTDSVRNTVVRGRWCEEVREKDSEHQMSISQSVHSL